MSKETQQVQRRKIIAPGCSIKGVSVGDVVDADLGCFVKPEFVSSVDDKELLTIYRIRPGEYYNSTGLEIERGKRYVRQGKIVERFARQIECYTPNSEDLAEKKIHDALNQILGDAGL